MSDERRSWAVSFDGGRPPTFNSERKQKHWSERAASTAMWREAFAVQARKKRIPHLDCVDVWARAFYRDDKHLPDVAAIAPAVKAAIDGLVDAGVIDDDDETHVRRVVFTRAIISELNVLHGDGLLLHVEEVIECCGRMAQWACTRPRHHDGPCRNRERWAE